MTIAEVSLLEPPAGFSLSFFDGDGLHCVPVALPRDGRIADLVAAGRLLDAYLQMVKNFTERQPHVG